MDTNNDRESPPVQPGMELRHTFPRSPTIEEAVARVASRGVALPPPRVEEKNLSPGSQVLVEQGLRQYGELRDELAQIKLEREQLISEAKLQSLTIDRLNLDVQDNRAKASQYEVERDAAVMARVQLQAQYGCFVNSLRNLLREMEEVEGKLVE